MIYYELPHSNIIHIPKTAGMFALMACIKSMDTYPQEKQGIPNNGKPSLTFVRHPLEWYPSWWAYDKSLIQGYYSPEQEAELMALYDPNFDTFIENVIADGNGFLGRFYADYTAHADTIGKTDTVKDDLINFLTEHGEEFDEEKIRAMGYVNKGVGVPLVREDLIEPLLTAEADVISAYYI